jgi:hypothetical protein
VSVMPGHSQEKCQIHPKLSSIVGRGLPCLLSATPSYVPIGDAASSAPSQFEWKRSFNPTRTKPTRQVICDSYFLTFFLLNQCLFEIYTFAETPETN